MCCLPWFLKYIVTADPAMRLIATAGTLAVWRHEGRGPAYVRFGNRVLYEGRELNRWLNAHRVEPVATTDNGSHR